MLEKIRLATPEEVQAIEADGCLTPMSRVLKMGEMTAVWRVAHEIDPVYVNGAPTQKLYKFLWGMENILRGAGVTEYFYNVDASDTKYHHILDELGGQRISKQPDFRYRVNL